MGKLLERRVKQTAISTAHSGGWLICNVAKEIGAHVVAEGDCMPNSGLTLCRNHNKREQW